jgi:hypothetical protein
MGELDDINYDLEGVSYGVLPDVSNSEPSMQPTTPTGNGTGYYVENGWLNSLAGTVGQALNSVIQRENAKTAQQTAITSAGVQMQTAQVQAGLANQRLLLIGGMVLVGLIALRG